MRLADHILAAEGTANDIEGMLGSIAQVLRRPDCQRFVFHDDFTHACFNLIASRPSSILTALPLSRIPFRRLWAEWTGGLFGKQDREDREAPVPVKVGMLIEDISGDGTFGVMTLCWLHRRDDTVLAAHSQAARDIMSGFDFTVNACPLSVYFDFQEEGNAASIVRMMMTAMRKAYEGDLWIDGLFKAMDTKFLQPLTELDDEYFFWHSHWRRYRDDPKEREAMLVSDTHLLPGPSPHGVRLASMIMQRASVSELRRMFNNWAFDIQGEGAFMHAALILLNARNRVIEHEPADLSKLNKARERRGKRPFLPYTVTRIVLNGTQTRRTEALGMSREVARQHLVRGHFKVRKGGVYWWSPFLRGDASRSVSRQGYEVKP